jgi:hypothetical protein
VLFEQRSAGRAGRFRRIIEAEADQRPRIGHRQFFADDPSRQKPRQLAKRARRQRLFGARKCELRSKIVRQRQKTNPCNGARHDLALVERI